jgi:hypothetical protein
MTPTTTRRFGWGFVFVSLLAAVGVYWVGAGYAHQRSELAAFTAAPVCAAGAEAPCRTVLTAVVQDIGFRGGGEGGTATSLDLKPTGGGLITTRINGRAGFETGEPVTVTVWRGKAALLLPADPGRAAIPTLDSPQWGVSNDATGVLVLMAFVLGVGAAAWLFLTYFSMRRRWAAPVHVVALVMFAAVLAWRIGNNYGALETVAFAWPPVFLLLTLSWMLFARDRARAAGESGR